MIQTQNNKVKNVITPSQKKYLDRISQYIQTRGYPPTLKELSVEFGCSISTAQHFVEVLTRKGYLRKAKNKTRAIMPIGIHYASVMKLGVIRAGEPIETYENPEPVAVPKDMLSKPGQYYALEVEGDSMIEDGVWDRDLILVKHQFHAEENDTVVAITENGATLKKLKYDKKKKPYLQPRNPKYDPIYPDQLEVRGRLVGIIHKEQ